ncbi:MAG: hypothetical protein LZF62_440042 [Nitrospira sp.]|nr:MAG: hypothetical protein LZF62_440042 [Nitrospira sp.]
MASVHRDPQFSAAAGSVFGLVVEVSPSYRSFSSSQFLFLRHACTEHLGFVGNLSHSLTKSVLTWMQRRLAAPPAHYLCSESVRPLQREVSPASLGIDKPTDRGYLCLCAAS